MVKNCQSIAFDYDFSPDPQEPIINSIFAQYERVLIESILTSFGLDFIVKDQHGGDVDTIHSVREIGKDPKMKYKSAQNQKDYENRGRYDKAAYHGDPRYTRVVRAAKKNFEQRGEKIEDTYVPGNQVIPRKASPIPRGQQGQLVPVVSAEEIHNDPGRVLAGLNGMELANSPDNLRYTNAALNLNLSNMTVDEYIAWCEKNPSKVNWNGEKGVPLPEDVKKRLRSEYARAKKIYDAKVAYAYYSSIKFRKDLTYAAVNVSWRMGLRQVLGFIFTEMWFCVKTELHSTDCTEAGLKTYFAAIANGIQHGYECAREKYPELFSKFINGAVAGALSSITTTLCNIFFTTAKNAVRIIRQCYASLVEALNILLINPNDYEFGDRMRAIVKTLSVGASITAGILASDAIAHTPLGTLGEIGQIVQNFCSVFVTGIMSCTLLAFLDHSNVVNDLVKCLNNIRTIESEVNYYRKWAKYFEQYAAQLMQIDLAQFEKESEVCREIASKLENAKTEKELNSALIQAFRSHDLPLPWDGFCSFDAFMNNSSAKLIFQ